MAGSGRKTFSPGDVLTSSDVQNYLMDQSVMVFAGTAARASAIPSPSAGMVAYSTATALQVYNGTAWVDLSTGYGVATGTAAASTAITVSSVNYTLLTFTADSNLVVSKAGLFDVCLVGGGGGGGSSNTANDSGGGGGAGGIVIQTVYLDAATYAIDIGAGGTGATTSAAGTIGLGSSINNTARSFSTVGGGFGAWVNVGVQNNAGSPGASGGGGSNRNFSTGSSSFLPTVLGFAGGNGTGTINQAAGGGGGATAVGANAVTTTGGAGGAGYDVGAFISGSLFKAGGGGGGAPTTGGAGGSSVGGAGGTSAGTAAAANTGGGGGGAGSVLGSSGGAGGSGIVYVRFKV